MAWVHCPVKITSPAPSPGFPLPANVACRAKCEIRYPASVMHVVCPYGHSFIATASELQDQARDGGDA